MNSARGDSHYASEIGNSQILESKHQKMRKLLLSIEQYQRLGDEDSAAIICRSLQSLSLTIDLSIFDPHTNVAAEFYANLYELMKRIEPRSQMAWYCVDVLSNACRNSFARSALIHTYQFIPSLSRLLSDQITTEKKVRLLRLMQELSCGIKISWQIPHLPHLLTTLARWVESDNEEVITLSLGVLVNMCYKNLPAIYTLSRNVDIKKFIRICMPLQGSVIEVHICKLLIILDYMNSELPENTLLKLVDSTFKWLGDAFISRDAILLRQIVEFFLDVLKQDRECKLLDTYGRYGTEIRKLMQIIESNSSKNSSAGDMGLDPECVSIMFQFLHALIETKLPQVSELNPYFINMALQWIQTDTVSSQALNILKTIAVQSAAEDKTILEPLVVGLPAFLLSLKSLNEDNIPTNSEHNKQIGALLLLLRGMLQVESIRPKVLQELQPELILKLFVPLIGEENSPKMRAVNIDTCSTEAVNLYVYAIALVNEMAKYDSVWSNRQLTLMINKEIDMVLAQALYYSPVEVKRTVLEMATMPNFSTHVVAQAMGNLQSMVLVNTANSPNTSKIANEFNFPVLSVAQLDRLDETLKRLKSIMSSNNIGNISTSEVMELYEYKLSSMAQAERAAMVNVETASEHCTRLQHRLAQQTAELNRLHQLLFRTQQCHEEAVRSKEYLEKSNSELKNKLEAEKGRYKASDSQLKHTQQLLQENQANLAEITRKLADMTTAKEQLDEQNNQFKQWIAKLEENGTRLEKNLQKKEEHLKQANATINDLMNQVNNLELNLKETVKNLNAKKQIIDTIMNVANSEKNKNF